MGGIDVLLNNAGGSCTKGPLHEQNPDPTLTPTLTPTPTLAPTLTTTPNPVPDPDPKQARYMSRAPQTFARCST